MKNNNFDIIGDIHGYADALIRLLDKLDYKQDNHGIYHHPERQVIFLGDFIDGGSEQAKVINTVKPMVESGYAEAIMANHEYNAICYHTFDKQGKPLRERGGNNEEQHEAFLKEFPLGENKTKEVIDWFKTLPLFLEKKDFRVIHACWDTKMIDEARKLLDSNHKITDEFLFNSANSGSTEYKIIETLLKGIELELPKGESFKDKKGHKRTAIRIKWWQEHAKTYRDYAVVHEDARVNIPETKLSLNQIVPAYKSEKPVFFGHYWMSRKPEILTDYVACLDYSVAKGDKLVCYQWNDGDSKLSNDNFESVEA
ncbi:MAG: metallophosphoesterase [Gammaproteobacteria bacterium]|nr:metallophosphoesterase [Gammaproteobacteria bacterium]